LVALLKVVPGTTVSLTVPVTVSVRVWPRGRSIAPAVVVEHACAGEGEAAGHVGAVQVGGDQGVALQLRSRRCR
jgi:hypothetical protein